MGILSSLFARKPENEEEKARKQFEVFKYDGIRAQRMGQIDYAHRCYEEALKCREDFETRNYLSQLLMRMGLLDEAAASLLVMVEQASQKEAVWIALAQVYSLQGNHEAMLDAAVRAVGADARNAEAHLMLAKAQVALERLPEAVGSLTAALELNPGQQEARLLRAEAFMRAGQDERAADDVALLLAAEPDHESALAVSGALAEKMGQEAEAEAAYKHILELNPFSWQAYERLGGICLRRSDYEACIELMDDALETDSSFAGAYQLRGEAKRRRGDEAGAQADFQQYDRASAEATAAVEPDGKTYLPTDLVGSMLGL